MEIEKQKIEELEKKYKETQSNYQYDYQGNVTQTELQEI